MAARLSALLLVLLGACGDPLVPAQANDAGCPPTWSAACEGNLRPACVADVTCTYASTSGRSVGIFKCVAAGVVCKLYSVR